MQEAQAVARPAGSRVLSLLLSLSRPKSPPKGKLQINATTLHPVSPPAFAKWTSLCDDHVYVNEVRHKPIDVWERGEETGIDNWGFWRSWRQQQEDLRPPTFFTVPAGLAGQ